MGIVCDGFRLPSHAGLVLLVLAVGSMTGGGRLDSRRRNAAAARHQLL